MEPLWSPAVATGGNRRAPERRNKPKPEPRVATGRGFERMVRRVDGSSPSEGFGKAPHVGAFSFRPACSSSNLRWVWSRLWSFRAHEAEFHRLTRRARDHQSSAPADAECGRSGQCRARSSRAIAALVLASGVLHSDASPERVAARIEATARDLSRGGRDLRYGWGLVDAGAATAPSRVPRPRGEGRRTPKLLGAAQSQRSLSSVIGR